MSAGEPLETEVIFCDENLHRLRHFPSDSIDLIYLDPPFFSNRQYEVIFGDEAEIRSFGERWKGGIEHYIGWMRQRIEHLYRVLKPTGSFYLHCDPASSHYLKTMVDEFFGSERFRNEIVWKRTSAHSSARRYGPVHDTILFYTKSDDYTWNQSFQGYDPLYIETFFDQEDADGRRWKRNDLTGAGIRQGETGKPWRGIDVTAKGRHWAYPPTELERLDAIGRIHWPKKPGGMPRLKQYPEDSRGVPLQDVWADIPPMHNLSKERVGYPTQKPEALMDRIIAASSNRGEIVLDPFCGCGTTVVVAARQQRRWIGIDISPTAVRVIKQRLDRAGIDANVRNLPATEAALKALQPFEFQNWIIATVHGTHAPRRSGDMGIDGYSFFERLPIQVKQSEKVGREVVDKFETAVRRARSDGGFIIPFSFARGAYEEAARAKAEGLNIALVTVSTLLDNPPDAPLDPNLNEMSTLLLTRAREAAAQATHRASRPELTADELATSADVG